MAAARMKPTGREPRHIVTWHRAVLQALTDTLRQTIVNVGIREPQNTICVAVDVFTRELRACPEAEVPVDGKAETWQFLRDFCRAYFPPGIEVIDRAIPRHEREEPDRNAGLAEVRKEVEERLATEPEVEAWPRGGVKTEPEVVNPQKSLFVE